jgi:hypothetical protein
MNKKYKFQVPFKIKFINGIESFSVKENIAIQEIKPSNVKFKLENVSVSLKIEYDPRNKKEVDGYFSIEDCVSLEEAFKIFEILKNLVSFLFEYKNYNKYSGNSFLELNYFSVSKEPCKNLDFNENSNKSISIKDNITIEDKVEISLPRRINLPSNFYLDKIQNVNFLLSNYYQALTALVPEQKFLSLFIILEYLESSDIYKKFLERMKNEGKVKFIFDETALEECSKNCVKYLNEDQVKVFNSWKASLKNKTNWSRTKKLFEFLKNFLGEKEGEIDIYINRLSEEDLKKIINMRNKIVHASEDREELDELLYYKLFPLCEQILKRELFK